MSDQHDGGLSVHRVAVVVFCEAEATDPGDAAHVARMALSQALREQRLPADAYADFGTSVPPRCADCGAGAALGPTGNMVRHVVGEPWAPEDVERSEGEARPAACGGSGQPPAKDNHPVVGYDRGRVPFRARIFEVMDVGVAAGNGYLWTQPTWKAFRS